MTIAPPPSSQPASPARPKRHSNWGLRLMALALSALAFLGLWQGAQRAAPPSPASQNSGGYAPPSGTSGVLLPPGGAGTHGSTRLS